MKMKETLQLGKTGFPMRGNLPVREASGKKNGKKIKFMKNVKRLMKVSQPLSCMMDRRMPMEIST